MTTHIHDRASLKALIKTNADRARTLRQEAREVSGLDRHWLKEDAKRDADNTRAMLLALGYLRGLTLAQMESEFSLPENLPSSQHILDYCGDAWNKGPDGQEHPADWADFKTALEAELKAWKAQLILNQQTRAAVARKRAEEAA